ASPGDFVDYQVYLPEAGEYRFAYRVASNITGKFEMLILQNEAETVLHEVTVNTGDWQNWKTQYYSAELPEGKFILRILVKSGEYNLNWLEVDTKTNKQDIKDPSSYFALTQNKGKLILHNKQALTETASFELYDLLGQKIISRTINLNGDPISTLDISQLKNGFYISKVNVNKQLYTQKIRIN
ncbi:MAG: carbohydrate-binding protein, partial [Prolixibacteraceae bacterium]|nr:carbohydrate-binding protein [Prolixibacteraceae bacterium]